jgi:hypothetical protein
MLRATTIVLVLLFLGMGTSFAQERRSSLEGTVRDSSGGVIAGARVTARGSALVREVSSVTDGQGRYQFLALPPGRYEVAATASGLVMKAAATASLELGQLLTIDLTLVPAGVTQRVEVKPVSPLIDVRQNAAGGIVPSEVIERIPKVRDYTGLVLSLPNVDYEARSGGIQIDGGSGADNRFFVDGVDRTDLLLGTSLSTNFFAKTVAPDFVEQAQVHQSGYNAEFRASIGGIVSAVTRNGGNTWRGMLGGYYTPNDLQGTARPLLQLKPTNQTVAEYIMVPRDWAIQREWLFEVGGPAIRDRLWVYGNYDNDVGVTRRTVTFQSNGQQGTFELKPVDHSGMYSLNAGLTSSVRTRLAGSYDRATRSAELPNIQTDGTSTSNPALFPDPRGRAFFQDSLSGTMDWMWSNKTFVNLSANRLSYGGHDTGTLSDVVAHVFVGSNFQFTDIPANLQHVNGFLDATPSARIVGDDYDRFSISADATRYATWHGAHRLKTGVQFERVGNDVLSGYQAPVILLFWDASYFTTDGTTARGPYGYYESTRPYTAGDVSASNVGLFAQDSWTVHPRLTLNLGLRAEREDVPSYRPENPGVHFGFGDKIAPRAGFAWDLAGNARWKLYGSWGVFYDLMKLTIGRVMFGASHSDDAYFTLDTPAWPSITCLQPLVSLSGCAGALIDKRDRVTPANQAGSSLVDPDLDPTRSQELTAAIEHEWRASTSVSVRYVHKWVDRAVEAVCDPKFACGVNNPGFGTGARPFGSAFPAQPPAKRVYDSAEFRVRKRLANRWSLDTNYVLSRLWGNWSGIASTDEAVLCLQPNSCMAFNSLYYSFDHAAHPTYGPLGTDRPHRVKAQVTYDFIWGTMIGVNYLAQSGRPFSTIMRLPGPWPVNFFPYGRGDLGRTPPLSQLDLLAQHEFRLPHHARLRAGINVLNVFDQSAAINIVNNPFRDPLSLSAEQFFAGFDPYAVAAANSRIRPDAQFGLANRYQPPRVVTFQMQVTF